MWLPTGRWLPQPLTNRAEFNRNPRKRQTSTLPIKAISAKVSRSRKLLICVVVLIGCVVIVWRIDRMRTARKRAHTSLARKLVDSHPEAPKGPEAQIMPLVDSGNVGEAPVDVSQPASEMPVDAVPVVAVTSAQPLASSSSAARQPSQPPSPLAEDTSEPTKTPPEMASTMNMYLAHAPLREPEVADPDSVTNRRILATMVQKAISNASANPIGNVPGH